MLRPAVAGFASAPRTPAWPSRICMRAGSWAALPQAGWAQIVCLIAILDNSLFAQDPNEAPGDVAAGIPWVRYSDPSVRCPGRTSVSLCCSRWPNTCSRLCHPHHKQVKEWKLNAERNNGRGAMMGIIGCMIHEGLTGNPIWPIDYEPGHFPLIPLETVWPVIFSMGNPYPTA